MLGIPVPNRQQSVSQFRIRNIVSGRPNAREGEINEPIGILARRMSMNQYVAAV